MIKVPRIITLTASIFGLIILYGPILVVIFYSFNSAEKGMIWQDFSLRWYWDVWKDKYILSSLFNSFRISLLTSFFSFLVGISIGYVIGIARKSKFLFLSTLLFIPLLAPDLLFAISNAFFYSWLGLDKGILTISLSQSIVGASYIALFISIRLHSINFKSYLISASSLGASPTRFFFDHYWRLAYPIALLGTGLVLMFSFQDFLYAFFCGGDGTTTLTIHIFSLIRFGPNGGLNVIYTLLIIVTWIILLTNTKFKIVGENHESF